MARNRVQFQKGYSLTQFMDEYGTEEKCTQALFRWRWPNGFVCSRCEETAAWARCHLEPGTVVVSDALGCFRAVRQAGCFHQPFVTGSGPASARHPALTWVNTILGNIKRSLHGTYHHLSSKHLPRYLAEFSYRFNRRFSLREQGQFLFEPPTGPVLVQPIDRHPIFDRLSRI